jgi:hypothetical protein
MEALSLKNYEKQIPRDIQVQASKLVVRECDDEGGGRYVAYVDEGKDSFDVSITVDKSTVVKAHECDCGVGSQTICKHRAALIAHVAEGNKTKAPKVAAAAKKKEPAKKQPKWAPLLESATEEDLRSWLKIHLPLNKELELAFTQHFRTIGKVLSFEEIGEVTANAIKTVLGRRSNIEQRDMNAIIKLWTGLHQPFLERYKNALADPDCFQGMHAVTESCMVFYYSFGSRGPGDIPAYIEKLLVETRPLMHQLKTTEAWETATGYFLDRLFHTTLHSWRLHYLLHIRALIREDESGRGKDLLKRFVDAFAEHALKKVVNSGSANAIVFYLLREKGQISKYLHLFTPERWSHSYNADLIQEFMAAGQTEKAVKASIEQINSNTNDEYDLPYLQILRKHYEEKGDEKNKLKIMTQLLPLEFSFEDFKQVYLNTPTEAARKSLRTKTFSKAKKAWGDGNINGIRFCFALLAEEKDGMGMIKLINESAPYAVLADYVGPMAKASKTALIKQLFEDVVSIAAPQKSNEPIRVEGMSLLYQALLKHFSNLELQEALEATRKARRGGYMWDNAFVRWLNEVVWK